MRLDALFSSPLIHDLAEAISPLGRKRRRHPVALHLAYGALARMWGSASRLDADLASRATWLEIADRYNAGADAHGGVRLDAVGVPLTSDTYRHARDRLTDLEVLEGLLDAFTDHSVRLARQAGLLDPNGKGSRTRPAPERTIYGDGTVVRPLYDPAKSPRTDPDAEEHHRHDGPIWGNDLVTIACRGPEVHRRVILAVGRVHQRGREADTAVDLIRQVHHYAGAGIQAVVYDGAFRGVHHEALMTDLGVIPVNKVHPANKDTNDRRVFRRVPLGQWHHEVRGRQCTHTLVAHAGSVHDSVLNDVGQLVLSDALERRQVRRQSRADGTWRFSLGVEVPCPRGQFTAWISPHRQTGEDGHGRPDQLRLLPEGDPYFQVLYGLRNDSESINAAYKRTLYVDRAAALGWRRQLLDLFSWALLTNSLAWHEHVEPFRSSVRGGDHPPYQGLKALRGEKTHANHDLPNPVSGDPGQS